MKSISTLLIVLILALGTLLTVSSDVGRQWLTTHLPALASSLSLSTLPTLPELPELPTFSLNESSRKEKQHLINRIQEIDRAEKDLAERLGRMESLLELQTDSTPEKTPLSGRIVALDKRIKETDQAQKQQEGIQGKHEKRLLTLERLAAKQRNTDKQASDETKKIANRLSRLENKWRRGDPEKRLKSLEKLRVGRRLKSLEKTQSSVQKVARQVTLLAAKKTGQRMESGRVQVKRHDRGWTLVDIFSKRRAFKKPVTFAAPYPEIPQVVLGITRISLPGEVTQLEILADKITSTGFELIIQTESGPRVKDAAVNWLAIGPEGAPPPKSETEEGDAEGNTEGGAPEKKATDGTNGKSEKKPSKKPPVDPKKGP